MEDKNILAKADAPPMSPMLMFDMDMSNDGVVSPSPLRNNLRNVHGSNGVPFHSSRNLFTGGQHKVQHQREEPSHITNCLHSRNVYSDHKLNHKLNHKLDCYFVASNRLKDENQTYAETEVDVSIKTSVAATGVENGLDSVAMPPPPVKKGPLGYLHAILRGKQEREEKKKEKEREGRSSSQADARTHGAEQNSLHLELKTSHSSMCAISTSASPVAVLVSKNIHAKSDRTMIGDPRNHTTTSSSTDTSAASGTATTAGSEMKFDFDPSMMSPAQFSHLARQEKHFLLSKINEREQGMVDVDDVNDEMTGCKSASDGEKSEAGEGDTLIDVDNREKTSDRLSSMLSSSETKSGKDIHLTVSLDNGGGNGSVNIIKIEQANDRTSCANSSGEKFKNDEDAHDTSEKEKKEVKEENEEIEIMRCDSPTNSTFPMLTSRLTFAKQQEKQRHKQASSTRARFSLSSLSSLQALNFSPNCFPMNNESTNPNSKNMPTSKNYKCGDTKNTNNRSGNRLQRGHSYHQHQHQHQFHFSPFSLQPMKAPPSLPPSLSPSLSSSTAPVSEFGAFAPVGAGTDAGGTSTKRGAGTESAETFEVKDLDVTAEALDVPSPLQKCLNTERAGHCSRGHIEMGIQGSECDDAARKDKDRSEAGEGGKDEPEEGGEAADDNTASKARLCVGDFELLNVVGRGAYGKVFQVRKRSTGILYAMKVLKKADIIKRKVVGHTKNERQVLEVVRHPFIVKLRYAFQTDTKLYLILDYLKGGELFTRLDKEMEFTEYDTAFYAAECLLAIEHLHSKDIIYRDLKPENILLDEEGHICLTDFGFAKAEVVRHDQTRTFCGTVHYMAPEIVRKCGHGKAADWWSLGVLIYEMLTGQTPFYARNRKSIQEKILNAPLKLPKWISLQAKSLLKGLLRRSIHKRLGSGSTGAEEIKKHAFFRKINWKQLQQKKTVPPYQPPIDNDLDVSHFDAKFTKEQALDSPADSPVSSPLSPWVGFSYTADSLRNSLLLPSALLSSVSNPNGISNDEDRHGTSMNVFNDRGEGRGDGSCDGDATGIHVKSSHIFQSSSRSNSKFNVVTPTFSSLVSPLPPPSSSISPSNGPKREKQENAKKHDVRGSKVISAGGNEQEAQKKEKDKVSFQTKGEVEIEPTPTKSTTTVTIATITKHGDSPDRKKKIDNVSASPSLLTTSLASFRKKRMQEQRREQMKQQQAKQKQKQKEKQKEQQLQQRKYLEQQQQHHQQQHERYKQMQKLSKSCDGCGDADKICAMPGINPNAKVKTNTKTDTRAHTKAKTNAWQTVGASSKRGTVVSQPNPMKNPLVSSLSAPLQSLTQAQKRRLRKKKKGL